MNDAAKIILGLALALSLFSGDAWAMSKCNDKYTFEYNVNQADVVFEGHVSKMGLFRLIDKKSDRHSNINQPATYLVTTTYSVDKNWKGASSLQPIVMFNPMPITTRHELAQTKKLLPKFEKEALGLKRIVTFQKEESAAFNDMYNAGMCGNDNYEIAPQKLKFLDQKFPSAVQQ